MDEKSIFRIDDNELTEKIAKEYPALTKEESERIYKQICRKLGNDSRPEELHEAVSGVERYRKPIWHRFFGIAASIAAFAGIAGSTVLLHRSAPKPTVEHNAVCSTEPGDTASAALYLTDSFLEAASYIKGEAAPEHRPQKIVFRGTDAENEAVYSPVTDTRFVVPADVTGLLEDIVTEEYMNELRETGGTYFGESIDILAGVDDSSDTPSFREFCGELYAIVSDETPPSFTETPKITSTDSSGFTVERSDGNELYFSVVWDGAQWRIDDIERNPL